MNSSSLEIRDIDIRRELHKTILKCHKNDPDTLIVEELGLFWGMSRVDIAVVNGFLSGFEIKSQVDDFARLSTQAENYSRIFDYLSIILHEKHLEKFRSNFNELDYWGIYVISGNRDNIKLFKYKSEIRNNNAEVFAQCHLMWKNEIIEIVSRNCPDISGLKSMKKQELYQVACENIEPEVLSSEIRQQLKIRKDWRVG